MKNLRRFINPSNRVFKSPRKITRVVVAPTSNYHPLLTVDQQKLILSQDGKRNLFNGDTVRMDKLSEDGTATLSKVHFFDFMTTNLVVKPASRTKRTALSNLYATLFSDDMKEVLRLERKVKAAVYAYPRKNFDQIIAVNELANIVTVSVLLRDSTGRYLIVHRGSKVAVSSGSFATSCAGSLAPEDLNEDNPFLACTRRELKEELNIDCDLMIKDLVISKQKLQPAVLISGTIDSTFETLYPTMLQAQDFHEENSELYAIPAPMLPGIVKHYQFTDVAAYQLAGSAKHWAIRLPVDIQRFKLDK